MEKIAFFGKGGIGKSTIASNITAALALKGRRVLHVGCDPKMDSTLLLMGRRIPSFAAARGCGDEDSLGASIHEAAVPGVHCIEAGGPEPGLGCAGAGIGRMFDVMRSVSLLEGGRYDAVVYDVLGDVVCGGFAAPLRLNFAAKTVIVTSETPYSLYAANRLIGMVSNFSRNGARLAGLVANLRTPAGEDIVRRFAGLTGARLLGTLLPDEAVARAERRRKPAVEVFPDSDFSRRVRRLLPAVTGPAPVRPARQLGDEDFFSFIEGRHTPPSAIPVPRSGKARPAGTVLAAAGFAPLGLEDGQVLCEWASPAGPRRVVMAHASSPHSGAFRLSDWKIFFHPSAPPADGSEAWALRDAASGLAELPFRDILRTLSAGTDFYSSIVRLCGPRDKDLRHKSDLGFGEGPFILSTPLMPFIPPGAVMAEYSDSECRFAACEGGALGLTHESDTASPRRGRSLGPLPPLPDERMDIAEIDMRDAVMGGEEKALAVLRRAADRTGPGGLVIFYTGCSMITLSFDPAEAMRKVEKEKGVRIVFADSGTLRDLPREADFAGFMTDRLRKARARRKSGVNLVGFGAAREPLARLLAGRGIPVKDPGPFYGTAGSAALNLLSDEALYMGPAFDRAGLPRLHAPAPYGFGAAREWLAAAAGALGIKGFKAGPSAEQAAAAARLREKTGEYSAALAVHYDGVAALESRRARAALSFIAEGGFGPALIVFTGGKEPPAGERAAAAARFAALARAAGKAPRSRPPEVKFMRSPADLRAALPGGRRPRLIYSDLRGDPRVVAAGRVPFSADIFLPGYDGALETWRRMIELCEWDFNEKYGVR